MITLLDRASECAGVDWSSCRHRGEGGKAGVGINCVIGFNNSDGCCDGKKKWVGRGGLGWMFVIDKIDGCVFGSEIDGRGENGGGEVKRARN